MATPAHEPDVLHGLVHAQLLKARASQRSFLAAAEALILVEEQVAAVMDRVAASGSPEFADRRRKLAQAARDCAAKVRASTDDRRRDQV